MALKIRLARAGSKKRPYYHVVVADVRSPRDGRFIESVGSWSPLLPKEGERIKLDADRIKHWLSHGALPTDRVLRFLDEAGLAKRPARSNPKKAEPGKKAQERHRRDQEGAGRCCRSTGGHRRSTCCGSSGRRSRGRVSRVSASIANGGPWPAVFFSACRRLNDCRARRGRR